MKNFYLIMVFVFAAFATNAQVLLSEDFESGVPGTWSQQTAATDGGWVGGSVAALSSTYWGPDDNGSNVVASNDDACNCDKSADYLVMPAVDLSSGAALLSFDYVFAGGSYDGATETFYVESSSDNGATWTVLQEIAGTGNLSWNSATIDLSGAGASDILAFRYNDGGGWTFGAMIDNVVIQVPLPDDAELTAITTSATQEIGAMVDIAGTITNVGSTAITALDITWNTLGGSGNTDQLTGLNIAPQTSYNFTHSTQLTVPAGSTTISVSIDAVNGGADSDASNNTMGLTISGVPFIPTKGIVFEEGTGTWCGWCPRGHVFMEYMEDTYDDFLGVAVHNSDPMANAAYDSGFGALIGGYPSGAADRNPNWSDIDPTEFEAAYMALQNEIAPAELTITDATLSESRELSVTVSAEFVVDLAGDYRLGLILTENDVVGSTAGYNQVNYYSFQTNDIALTGAGHDWQAEPDPVPAADMVYDHVGREMVGGFTGAAGSLPATIASGETHTYTFTYTVPADWNEANMHLIATLHDNQNSTVGQIMNGLGGDMPQITTSNDNLLPSNTVNVFPNPTSDLAYVQVDLEEAADVTIEIYNNLGQVVSSRNLGQLNGNMVVPVNASAFSAGMYNVHVTAGDKYITKKLVIKK